MKICVIGTRGFPKVEGGVEKHCELLYPLLAEQAEVVVFRRKPYVNSQKQYKNIRFVDLPSTKIKGVEAVVHSFLAAVCAIAMKPDVVHFHNIGPALFAPLIKLFSIPVVMTYHSANYEHKKWGTFAKKLLRFSEKVALKSADRIFFVNRFQMEKYPEDVRRKSAYIPNGIQPPEKEEGTQYLEGLKLEPGKYILSVGRITPEKGFHTLIRAFSEAKPEGYKLVIAGGVEFESGYMKQLQQLCEGLPVVFTGYVHGSDLAQLYSNAALFVLASENEGFPLVLLEAMSYERSVLVSDIPGTRLVKLDEEDYFEQGNHGLLAQKLTGKLSRKTGKTYDLSEYDWNEISNQVLKLMEEAING